MKKCNSLKALFCFSLMMVFSVLANAQGWKNILSGVADAVGEKVTEKVSEKVNLFSVTGTWNYVSPDCKFVSDDLLSKAGGELAAKKIEDHMTKVLSHVGIKEGTTFTFAADSTYAITLGNRTVRGTYTLNQETKEIIMTSRLKFEFKAKAQKNILEPNKMSLLFSADKLMSFIKNVGTSLTKKSSNKSVSSATSFLNSYDGLMLGYELIKQ